MGALMLLLLLICLIICCVRCCACCCVGTKEQEAGKNEQRTITQLYFNENTLYVCPICTVEPPNKRTQYKFSCCVLGREVVLSSEVQNVLEL